MGQRYASVRRFISLAVTMTNPSCCSDGWLDLSAPFIAAYKAGATSVNSFITQGQFSIKRTLRDFDFNGFRQIDLLVQTSAY
jgi:hypothetical protein